MRKNRCLLETYRDLLIITKKPMTLSSIFYEIKSSYPFLKPKVNKLLESNMLVLDDKKYRTTQRGNMFIEKINDTLAFLEGKQN